MNVFYILIFMYSHIIYLRWLVGLCEKTYHGFFFLGESRPIMVAYITKINFYISIITKLKKCWYLAGKIGGKWQLVVCTSTEKWLENETDASGHPPMSAKHTRRHGTKQDTMHVPFPLLRFCPSSPFNSTFHILFLSYYHPLNSSW